MRKISWFFVFILPFSLFSEDTGGMAGFEFLRSDMGARPGAMGGAFIAVPGDLQGTAYNPANIVGIENRTVVASYTDHILDFNQGFIGYAQNVAQAGIFGVGVSYMSYGEFIRTDPEGNENGTFHPSDLLLAVTYGDRPIENLSYGVSAKYIRSQIDGYTSSALAADLGLIFSIPKEQLDLALAFLNLGKSVDAFVEDHESLPMAVRLGFGKRLAHLPLLLNFHFLRYSDLESDLFWGLYWALGGEFTISEKLFLRLGYNSRGSEQKTDSNSDRFAGISIGLGLIFSKYHIDYARSSQGIIGSLNQFSLSMTF